MLGFIIGGIALVPAYGYYSNIYLPSTTNPSQHGDPFTTLWNGQIPQTYSSITGATFDFFAGPPNGAPNNGIQCGGGCAGVQTFSHAVFASEIILVVIELDLNNTSCLGVSDSQGNSYSIENCFATHNMVEQIEFSRMSGTGSVTFSLTATAGNYYASFFGYRGVGTVLPSVSHVVTTSSAASTDAITTSAFSGILFGRFTIDNTTIAGAVGLTGTARQGFTWIATDTRVISAGESSTIPTITWSWTGMTCHVCFLTNVAIPLTNGQPNTCDSTGYQCFNAIVVGGNIEMKQNATFPAIALTNSSIDLSQGVGKALTMAFSIAQYPGAFGPSQGLTVGWFLRQNSTLPNTLGWTPLKDNAVALLVMFTVNPGVINYYVYIQRQLGQQLWQGSPTPTCNQVATIFLCAKNSTTPGTLALPLELNFTGATASGSGVTTASSESYLCTDIGKASTTCNLGGENNQPVSWANTNLQLNFTLPWLNIQNNYYAGLWESAGSPGSGSFQWNTAQSLGPNSIISVFTPPASSQNPNIAEGGFFGWIGRSLGGAWNAAAGALAPITNPILGFGNSLLSVFTSGLIQAGNLLIQGLTTLESIMVGVMNVIGNFLGWGNVGTSMQQMINALVTLFTNGSVATFFGDLPTIFARLIDNIDIAIPWLPIAFNTASNLTLLGVNAIVFLPTLIKFVFFWVSGVFVTVLILFWFIYTGDDALGGMLGFLETTEWLIFGIGLGFVAELVNYFLDIVTYLIGLIPKPFVQMVAHAVPRMPVVQTNANFVSPSFDLAEVRAGNMLSILSWMIGVTFLDWYEQVTPALPGSIGALLPSAASSLTGLAGLLPLLEILTAFVGVAAIVFWPLMRMMEFSLGEVGGPSVTLGPGRRLNAGPSGIHIGSGTKHFQGRLEKKLGLRVEEKKQEAEIKSSGASSMGVG